MTDVAKKIETAQLIEQAANVNSREALAEWMLQPEIDEDPATTELRKQTFENYIIQDSVKETFDKILKIENVETKQKLMQKLKKNFLDACDGPNQTPPEVLKTEREIEAWILKPEKEETESELKAQVWKKYSSQESTKAIFEKILNLDSFSKQLTHLTGFKNVFMEVVKNAEEKAMNDFQLVEKGDSDFLFPDEEAQTKVATAMPERFHNVKQLEIWIFAQYEDEEEQFKKFMRMVWPSFIEQEEVKQVLGKIFTKTGLRLLYLINKFKATLEAACKDVMNEIEKPLKTHQVKEYLFKDEKTKALSRELKENTWKFFSEIELISKQITEAKRAKPNDRKQLLNNLRKEFRELVEEESELKDAPGRFRSIEHVAAESFSSDTSLASDEDFQDLKASVWKKYVFHEANKDIVLEIVNSKKLKEEERLKMLRKDFVEITKSEYREKIKVDQSNNPDVPKFKTDWKKLQPDYRHEDDDTRYFGQYVF